MRNLGGLRGRLEKLEALAWERDRQREEENFNRFLSLDPEARKTQAPIAGLIAASDLTPPANFLRGVDEQARLRVWRMRETPGVVECYRELQRRWAITMGEDWRLADPWTDIPEEVR